jgi:HEAT repeat protein
MSEIASPPGGAGDDIPRKADIGSLVAALASSDRVTRQNAREALVALGHPAVGPLIALLDDRNDHVRWEAAKSLSEIGDPAAAEALVRTLEDREAGVRWLAAEGLIRMRKASLPPLWPEVRAILYRALIELPDSQWLREGAHDVLHDGPSWGWMTAWHLCSPRWKTSSPQRQCRQPRGRPWA